MESHFDTISNGSVSCNLHSTKYEVVKFVCKKLFGWNYKNQNSEWDLMWTDSAISNDLLKKMNRYQKVNHFPGMYAISQKNYLATNLNKLQKKFQCDYNFFPKTWVAPIKQIDLKMFLHSSTSYFIVKPEASCQGRGIFLTRNLEEIDLNKHIVQEYISNPYLINGLKFDLRIYVLLTGCSPLRVFVYKEGIARFATEKYVKPSNENAPNRFIHLTNYAINKQSPNFVKANDDSGHKRSLSAILKILEENGADTKKLLGQIDEIIVKTLCCIQPILAQYYTSSQPSDYSNSMCFELLGFDIIIDSSLKPYVLEVNHSPSFSTDSPLDWKIKKKLISDTLKLLKIREKDRQKYLEKQKLKNKIRSISGPIEKVSKEKKEEKKLFAKVKRDLWEGCNLGRFRKVYPIGGFEKYDKFVIAADNLWQEYNGTKKKKTMIRIVKKSNSEILVREKTDFYGLKDLSLLDRLSQKKKKLSGENISKILNQDLHPRNTSLEEKTIQKSSKHIDKSFEIRVFPEVKAANFPKLKQIISRKRPTLKDLLLCQDLKFIMKKKVN